MLLPPLQLRTRLGVDRDKPWNSVRINLGLDLRDLNIRGLDKRHLIIVGHRWCSIIVSAPVPVPFLLTLDFGFEILDLELGYRSWT